MSEIIVGRELVVKVASTSIKGVEGGTFPGTPMISMMDTLGTHHNYGVDPKEFTCNQFLYPDDVADLESAIADHTTVAVSPMIGASITQLTPWQFTAAFVKADINFAGPDQGAKRALQFAQE